MAEQANQTAFPLVSIVTVNFNQPELTALMLDSLRQVTYPNLEVFVVDNGSSKGDIRQIQPDYPEATFLISDTNLGFAGGNNLAFPYTKGQYVLLLNNDTEVDPGFLEPMVSLMEADETVGVVSPKIYFYDEPNRLQYAGTTSIHPITSRGSKFGYREIDQGQHDQLKETGYPNGACMLVRGDLLQRFGYLYEHYFLYYEEHDWAFRVNRAGYRLLFQPASAIRHKVSASTGRLSPLKAYYLHRNRWLFIRRNRKGWTRLLATLYFLGFATPKTWLSYVLQGDWQRVKAIHKAIRWNLRHRVLPTGPYDPQVQTEHFPASLSYPVQIISTKTT